MKKQEIKLKKGKNNYSILVGNKVIKLLPKKISYLCPKVQKIVIIFDKNVPKKFLSELKFSLKKYKPIFLPFAANEKTKSMKTVEIYLNKLLSINLKRNDLLIAVGGGITGDVTGFVASIFKRGINFINIPTTLLAQVDASIGGKTGVNSPYGKNLIGAFYQPRFVLSDTSFLKSLSKKQMICGYAEILKHAIIKDNNFFRWLKLNSKSIFNKDPKKLIYAIKKSILIKIYFVQKDIHEKNLRMILNFGHTFAHAIEVKNNYSNKISHGEAVLSGMVLATRLSVFKKICSKKTLDDIVDIYKKNNLFFTYRRFSNHKLLLNLLPFLKNDKKNVDEKINFILLKKIGKTTLPGQSKISFSELKKISKVIARY